MEMEIELAEKLEFLISKKSRYKVAYGGRGASKSWGVADSLIFHVITNPHKQYRILCTRELQNSIKESVHQLLCDRIQHYNLEGFFIPTENEIRCSNGSHFIFKGLRSNPTEIKSLEGVDICWIEEAQKITEKSLDVLTPTIRSDGSEIWITFNTGAESDPVYERWVKTIRDDTICTLINFYDNPWFPEVLRKEMEFDKEHKPELYKNKWLGEPATVGVFFNTFGEHLMVKPRMLTDSIEGYLYGSLDHGTTHNTSFGLWLITKDMRVIRLMSYSANGGTAQTHAMEIQDRIESFIYTGGRFPDIIYADPAMWTKVKLNEQMVRSPIDEYIDHFKDKNRHSVFERANNNKINGCAIMREMFAVKDGQAQFEYWDTFNASMAEGLRRVVTDENSPEVYAKQDGDDEVDEARYGIVACYSLIHNKYKSKQNPANKASDIKATIAKFNSRQFSQTGAL